MTALFSPSFPDLRLKCTFIIIVLVVRFSAYNLAVAFATKEPIITSEIEPGFVPWHEFPTHDHQDNIELLPPAVVFNDSIVQALHLTLYGHDSVLATWLFPAPYKPRTRKPACSFTSDANKYYISEGRAYTYIGGCFDATLNSVVINITKVTPDIYRRITYRCGDSKYGWSHWYSFQREKPTIINGSSNAMKVNSNNEDKLSTNPDTIFNHKTYEENVALMVKESFDESTGKRLGHTNDDLTQAFGSSEAMIAILGDMSAPYGDSTIDCIRQLTTKNRVKLLVHAGDISYADDYDKRGKPINNSYIFTDYMNKMADIATKIPYMTCPGNHERQFDFAAYKNWFPVPYNQSNSTDCMWYSFDYMGVHFVSFSTEHDFSKGSPQNDWIKSDLKRANENRMRVPWVVVFGHRPLYCTSGVGYQKFRCKVEAAFYRAYLEDLLHEARVDVHICGHNHDYERSYPVYKQNATSFNYTNPTAPVYIVNGEAGNVEKNYKEFSPSVPWRAHYNPNKDNGFLLMVPSHRQLRFMYVDSTLKRVVDNFTITRE